MTSFSCATSVVDSGARRDGCTDSQRWPLPREFGLGEPLREADLPELYRI
jgi:hypothetical protein